jgi:hypothetical protein
VLQTTQVNTTKGGLQKISFPVTDVAPATERLAEIEMSAAMERTVRSKLIVWTRTKQKVVEGSDFHPLIAAAALAYQKHYPLLLSPDMIWLTILQGVAQHVANNSESLRDKLVAHRTRIELIVEGNELPTSDALMLSATQEFIKQIENHVLPEKRFLLSAEFSTTTDVERIAGAIIVMDAFQPYFDYVFAIICGIPSVTLEGSTTDWELLRNKVQSLHHSNLELSWWTKHLLPLCDQFVRASRGDVDKKHWNNLCKLIERYGVDDLNGWLLKFIPYVRKDKNERPIHRNPVIELTEFPMDKNIHGPITGCTSDMLPTGLASAPVTVTDVEKKATRQLQFIAGFAGVTQAQDLSLRPLVGWAIAEGTRIDKLIAQLRSEHAVQAPSGPNTEQLLEIFERNLPADLWRFYSETNGARLEGQDALGKFNCVIHSASEVRPAFDVDSIHRELKFLVKQGLITNDYRDQRIQSMRSYAEMRVFAETQSYGSSPAHHIYVFGRDPERWSTLENKPSRGMIFRWNGEPTSQAFEPVAHTFSDWLEAMLERFPSKSK